MFALSRCTDAWTLRQQRQLRYIAEYTADIHYVPGVENVVADTLSRPPAGEAQQPLAASLCARPPGAVISQQPAGVVQQTQAASLCAQQPYCDATLDPFGWVTPAEREGVAGAAGVAQQPQAASLCARPPAAVISLLPAGAAQQPQAARLHARPPAAVISSSPTQVPPFTGSSFHWWGDTKLLCDFSTGAP